MLPRAMLGSHRAGQDVTNVSTVLFFNFMLPDGCTIHFTAFDKCKQQPSVTFHRKEIHCTSKYTSTAGLQCSRCPFEQFVGKQGFQPQGEHELEHEPNKGESNGEADVSRSEKGKHSRTQ